MEPDSGFARERFVPASAFDPIVVNRPPRHASSTLKLAVLNAHGGVHFDGILKCLRRAPLADTDIIMLCEADWRLRRSAGREIASELAAQLDMSFAYVPEFALRRSTGELSSFVGNAILSRHPLTDVRGIPLPNIYLEWRMHRLVGTPTGLTATVTVNRRRITLGVAHLNSRWNPEGRAHQMAQFLGWLPREGAALIGGDFNTTTLDLREPSALVRKLPRLLLEPARLRNPERYEPLFERLAAAGFELHGANVPGKPTFTFTRAIPPLFRPKLDWIAHRGLKIVAGTAAVVQARPSLVASRVSDHDFVICTVHV